MISLHIISQILPEKKGEMRFIPTFLVLTTGAESCILSLQLNSEYDICNLFRAYRV